LGSRRRLVLLRFRKEGHLVQRQMCTFAQTIAAEPELSVDVISSSAEFLASQEQWDRLVAHSPIDHPFMSHVWLTTWWEAFSKREELRIFVVKSAGEWIAAAPMMIRRTSMYGVPVHRLEALVNSHSPRFEFPVRSRHSEVYEAFWRAFSDPSAPWDVVVLPQFVATSQTLTALETITDSAGWQSGRWIGPPSPYVPLNCDYDELLGRLKAKERSNLRRRFNKLAELGDIEMEVVKAPSAVVRAISDGMRIEAAAWKARAGTAIISDLPVQHFYSTFAERAADRGWIKLAFLRVNGKRIAFHYILDVDGVVYDMKMGYDPHHHTYAPGHTLLTMILRDACESGRREFDFLGTDDAWKLVWTRDVRAHEWLFLFRDSYRGRLLYYLKFGVVPKLRQNEWLRRLMKGVRSSGLKQNVIH
jgi:CelD/BcsL family acetyltransferase involved in cellulose biosynthesis